MANVIVIGGGAAGLLAAATAAQNGHNVTLFEQNEKLGKKLYITGKGRCNITNAGGREAFFSHVIRNSRFLYSAWSACTDTDIVRLLNDLGVPTKTERGERVYPLSDKSSDVLRALSSHAQRCGVRVRLNDKVQKIVVEQNAIKAVALQNGSLQTDAAILCTGGMSYPSTGSTGDGYRFAQLCGHTVLPPRPSLVPLETTEQWPATLSGLTLKNVRLRAIEGGKTVYDELGEMLFSHFGVTGPLVLSASAYIDCFEGARLEIDLKPGLHNEQLDARLQRDIAEAGRQTIKNAFKGLLPQSLLPIVLEQAGLAGDRQASELTRASRQSLATVLKALPLTVRGTRGFSEAVITRGGVSTKEVQPSTLESKIVKGLYFAGEILDVDALTGGYNLQIAWSTGTLAGLLKGL